LRQFARDERVPVRPGLLYLVTGGAVRLIGSAASRRFRSGRSADRLETAEVLLGIWGDGQLLEVNPRPPYQLQVLAQTTPTTVAWFYPADLDDWPQLRESLLLGLRDQHQQRLLWLCSQGQQRALDRLLGLICLLVDEHGQVQGDRRVLPWPLTTAQLALAIGSTRATVERLLERLAQQGVLDWRDQEWLGLAIASPLLGADPQASMRGSPRL
jgi:CRP-like cAMP-binding protein